MSPFNFSSIHRGCLALNGRLRVTFQDDRDPKPLVRIFTPTGATFLLTETHPEDPDQAYGLCDDGDGRPEVRFVSLRTLHDRGGMLDPTFKGTHPLSHYAGVAAIAGRTVTAG